jgi:tetratricopeptide (TPR) repeat protein
MDMSGREIQSSGHSQGKMLLWMVIILTIITIVYIPVFQNGFLKTWDDNRYVIENKFILDLSPGSALKMFTIYYDGHYHPLTLISLAADYKIGGLNPKTFHITNLILHLINAILIFGFVYLLLKRKDLLVPVVVSLLFSLSTVNVESVAWISERKNLLYSLFFFASLIAYLQYLELNLKGLYFLSLLFFLFSLLSKSMALSLPVTLILTDFFYQRKVLYRKVILEKLPFFFLAIAFGIVAVLAQKSTWGEDLSQVHFSFFERILFGGYAFVIYFIKTIIPFRMSGFYPYPELSGLTSAFYISCVLVALTVFVLAIYSFRKNQIPAFGLLFFCINIFLLLKIFEVPAGDYIMADRYCYIPSVGIFILFGTGLKYLMDRNAYIRYIGLTILIVYTMFISLQTFNRLSVWKDDVSFYSDIIAKFPETEVAYTNRGALRKENHELDGALSDFNKAIQLGKNDYKSFSNRGAVFLDLGEYKSAMADYEQAIKFKPGHPQILADYGFAQMRTGNYKGALESYNRSLSINSFNPEVYVNRGTTLYNMGDLHAAITDYDIAIKQKPEYANAFFNRGLAKIMLNDLNAAINDFTITLKLDPGHVEAWSNMGVAWSRLNNINKAMECYAEAIKLKPAYFEAWLNRGIDKYYGGDFTGAMADLDRSIVLNPSLGPAYYFRGLVKLKAGGSSACEDLKRAFELGFNQAIETMKIACH